MKYSVKTILFFVMVGFVCSCEKVTVEPPELDTSVPILFEQDIIPIFESKCVACHNGSRNPDLRAENAHESLTTDGYVNIDEPELSTLYEVLYGTHDTRATELEKSTILAWIEQGANND